jgi:hypothetical protein
MISLCYIYTKLASVFVFEVELEKEQMEYLKNNCVVNSGDCHFIFPFEEMVETIFDNVKIVRQITKTNIDYIGQSIGKITKEATRHYDRVKVTFVID